VQTPIHLFATALFLCFRNGRLFQVTTCDFVPAGPLAIPKLELCVPPGMWQVTPAGRPFGILGQFVDDPVQGRLVHLLVGMVRSEMAGCGRIRVSCSLNEKL